MYCRVLSLRYLKVGKQRHLQRSRLKIHHIFIFRFEAHTLSGSELSGSELNGRSTRNPNLNIPSLTFVRVSQGPGLSKVFTESL